MITARDTLEKCCQRLQGLSEGIDRIRSIGKSSGALVAPPPTPSSSSVSIVSMPPKRAPARCHECHGPLAGYHQGYQHGLDLCQLEHYDLCGGGVTEKDRGGNSWRPCPSEYEPPLATEEDLVDNEMENSDSDSSQKDDPDYNPGEFSPPPQLQRREKVKEVMEKHLKLWMARLQEILTLSKLTLLLLQLKLLQLSIVSSQQTT